MLHNVLTFQTMAKTIAERQRKYRERKREKDGLKYLENERNQQKRNYIKVKDLSKKQLKEQREAVKLRVQKNRKLTKQLLESACNTPLTTSSTASPMSDSLPFLIAMSFLKRGESSRKRKQRNDDRFYEKIAKLENEKKALKKSNVTLRQRVHRMKKKKQKDNSQVLTPQRSVSNMLKSEGLSPDKTSRDRKKSLLFAKVVSEEIQASVHERKNKKADIQRLVSGKILKKYKLMKYASEKTGNNRTKMCRTSSKVLNVPKAKRGLNLQIHTEVLKFYTQDNNSTALPGKKDCKRVKKAQIQKQSLNDYLSNLYHKLKVEQPELKVSFASFAKMRPTSYILANFVNRRSCLCTKHQNLL